MSQPRLAYAPVLNAAINHNQKMILLNLEKYLDLKRAKYREANKTGVTIDYVLEFGSQLGMCSGLNAYWLYSKRMGLEREFFKAIEYACTWDPQNFADSASLEDSRLEELMNIIGFLHNDQKLRENIRQDNLSAGINFLSSKFSRKPLAQEFAITFVFTRANLAEFIKSYCAENKMVRFDNGFHVVSVIKIDGLYYFYDSFDKQGQQEFSDPKKISNQIFNSLAKLCKSKKHMALRISISDLASEPRPNYSDPIDYSIQAMQDPEYKKAVLQHKNLFHLAARFNDYKLLDLLFASGYKYIPWKLNEDTELNEAVSLNDPDEIDYLLDHHIPIEYRTRNGVTAFGRAIMENMPHLMYKLFQSGADVMRQPIRGYSAVDIAITYKKAEPLILLLALGVGITHEQVAKLKRIFGQVNEQKIIDRALDLNKHMLKAPTDLDINEATTGRSIVAFLEHKALANKLGYPISQIKVKVHGLPQVGQMALRAIAEYYQQNSDNDMFSFPEKVEIYRLLREFDVDLFDFDGNDHMLQLIKQIPKLITSKSLNQYDDAELIEIAKILDELTELSAYKFSLDLKEMYICYKAGVAKRSIEDYLRLNGVPDLNQRLVSLKRPKGLITSPMFFSAERKSAPEILSYQSDIAPSLRL